MIWCVSFWSSGSSCVATLTLSSWLVVMCTGDPKLTSNHGISGPGKGDLESLSGAGIFLPGMYLTV